MKRLTLKRIAIALFVALSILALGYLESHFGITPNH
jgi:hypothetical protein